MALVTRDSEVIYVGDQPVGFTISKIPPSETSNGAGDGEVLQAVLIMEEGGPVRFNAVAGRDVSPDGIDGSLLLKRGGRLTVIGSEDLVNFSMLRANHRETTKVVVRYEGYGGN